MTKMEKGDAIARIVQLVKESSPMGGFVKNDTDNGRWYIIKDSEARDKVGHAIRKAVQRLEDTRPKLAARLKRGHLSSVSSSSSTAATKSVNPLHDTTSTASSTSRSSDSPGIVKDTSTKRVELKKTPSLPTYASSSSSSSSATGVDTRGISTGGVIDAFNNTSPIDIMARIEEERANRAAIAAVLGPQFTGANNTGASLALRSATAASAVQQHPSLTSMALEATVHPGMLASSNRQIEASNFLEGRLSSTQSAFAAAAAAASGTATNTASLLSSYEQMLLMQIQEQRSNDQLHLIRALQQQEEAKLRREIEYSSHRLATFEPLSRSPASFLGGTNPSSALLPLGSAAMNINPMNPTGQGNTNLSLSPALLQHLLSNGRPLSPTAIALAQERLRNMLNRDEGSNSDSKRGEGGP
jgi:hypothetical protein